MIWHVGGANTDETFNGVIDNCASSTASKYDGTTNIIKEGDGIWRLTGTNIYSGYTNINGGKLIVNGKNNGKGSVVVNASGILAGRGTIAGAVTVREDGAIQPGDEGVDGKSLTLASTLVVQGGGIVSIPANQQTCNTLVVNGNITLQEGAVLQLADGRFEDAPTVGTAFRVMTVKGSLSGQFAEIFPATPGAGLAWDTSELYTTGIIKVVDDTNGIGFVTPYVAPLRVEYYTLAGKRIDVPKGVCVEKAVMVDGTFRSRKVVR